MYLKTFFVATTSNCSVKKNHNTSSQALTVRNTKKYIQLTFLPFLHKIKQTSPHPLYARLLQMFHSFYSPITTANTSLPNVHAESLLQT